MPIHSDKSRKLECIHIFFNFRISAFQMIGKYSITHHPVSDTVKVIIIDLLGMVQRADDCIHEETVFLANVCFPQANCLRNRSDEKYFSLLLMF